MVDWRSTWRAIVASDMSGRDGVVWEFTSHDGREGVWAVFREDGGPFPVFSSSRGEGNLPSRDELEQMTTAAVADLLASADVENETGWLARNITAALLIASLEIVSWEGVEWALESDANDEGLVWAGPEAARTPYAWLRALGAASDALIDIYQDDAVFGLCFVPTTTHRLPDSDEGSLRAGRDIPLVRGPINQVEVVCDTVVEGGHRPGLVTEALLHGDGDSTLFIAAEAYSTDEWHLYDESIVAISDVATADALDWLPARQKWRPSKGHTD